MPLGRFNSPNPTPPRSVLRRWVNGRRMMSFGRVRLFCSDILKFEIHWANTWNAIRLRRWRQRASNTERMTSPWLSWSWTTAKFAHLMQATQPPQSQTLRSIARHMTNCARLRVFERWRFISIDIRHGCNYAQYFDVLMLHTHEIQRSSTSWKLYDVASFVYLKHAFLRISPFVWWLNNGRFRDNIYKWHHI